MSSQTSRARLRSFRAFTFVIYFGLVLIALLVTGALSYRQNQISLLSFIQDTNAQYIQQTGRLLDSILYEFSYTSAALAQDASVAAILSPTSSDAQRIRTESTVEELLRFVVSATRNATSAYVYSGESERISTTHGTVAASLFSDRDWLLSIDEIPPNSPKVMYRRIEKFQEDLISIVRRIDSNRGLIGAIVINIPVDAIRRTLGSSRINRAEEFLIVDRDQTVLFSFSDSHLARKRNAVITDADTSFTAESPSQLFGLTYVVSRGETAFEENLGTLRTYLVVLVVAVSLIGSVLALVLSGIAHRPIREIMATIEDPEHERRAAWSEDIQFIENTIVQSIASNRDLEGRLADRIESLRETTYIALQLQLNPHFLHNTLESLYWSSLETNAPDAPVPSSLLSLSRMLRLVLDAEEMAVPLQSEIDLTNHYVDILTARFPGLVSVEWDVPSGLTERLVPKLLLQPLVENAFYHGIKPLRRSGHIVIECRLHGDEMVIRVSDDGAGMEHDLLQSIQDDMDSEIHIASKHIGVLNVSQRVRILFGDRGRMTISSTPGTGTSVAVHVPEQPAAVPIG